LWYFDRYSQKFGIIQESLTNICKHASATEVEINLQTGKNLMLKIIDNGKGFQLEGNTSGFGLHSMSVSEAYRRYRALSVGGNLHIQTAPNTGCEIVAIFPFN
jgi:signal transduction histidine kinase